MAIWFVFDLDFTLYGKHMHRFENNERAFYRNLHWNRHLNVLLKQLKEMGQVLLFTNGNDAHAKESLRRMRLKSLFGSNIVTRDTYSAMKPDPYVYYKTHMDKHMTRGPVLFFDDTAENLIAAKSLLGWNTVLIGSSPKGRRAQTYIDYYFPTVEVALESLLRLYARKQHSRHRRHRRHRSSHRSSHRVTIRA